jgi:proline dehydrogenase
MRRLLLKASENKWLRQRAVNYGVLRRASRRFLPGETANEALAACQELAKEKIHSVLTHLGENVTTGIEAAEVTRHYLGLINGVRAAGVPSEVSVKLTQLGLDLDADVCLSNISKLLEAAPTDRILWIDMEQSSYVDATFDLLWRVRRKHAHVGICIQSYLRRSERDIEALISSGTAVRLVKGAYREASTMAFAKKQDVDENYFRLAKRLLDRESRGNNVRVALATHDRNLVDRIRAWAAFEGMNRSNLEFQMLYGIQRTQQSTLAENGHRVGVLVSYGRYWFPWFMRRLAERPANMLFLLRNLT